MTQLETVVFTPEVLFLVVYILCCLFFLVTYYRDSEDAVYGRDGYDYDGYRLRVEFPRSGRGGGGGGGGGSGGMGPPRSRYGPPSRRSEYRILVTGG